MSALSPDMAAMGLLRSCALAPYRAGQRPQDRPQDLACWPTPLPPPKKDGYARCALSTTCC